MNAWGMLKIWNINISLKKAIAICTAIAFLFSLIGSDLAWAIAPESLLTPSGGENPAGPAKFNLKEFVLPSYLGHTENLSAGLSSRAVIHIQDAHCNYAAQRSIEKIIHYLNENYGLNLINLEGGFGKYDFSLFDDISDVRIKRKVADYFLKEARINGAEFFAITNPGTVTLWGIDSRDWYFKDLDAYRSYIPQKKTVDRELNVMKLLIARLKKKIYGEELLEFDKRTEAFNQDKSDFKGYILYLISMADNKSININDLRNIGLLEKVLSLEEGIDFKEADKERTALIEELERRLSKLEREDLVLKALEFKATTLSQKDFYKYLKGKADESKIDKENYPNLSKYIGYIYLYGSIDNAELFDEIENIEDRVKTGLFENKAQEKLAFYSKCFNAFDKVLNVNATKRDYEFFKNEASKIGIFGIARYVKTQCKDLGIECSLGEDVLDLKEGLKDITTFYDYANKRDKSFISNTLEKMDESGETVSIIITGGFHTDKLRELFKAEGVSYVSIIPNFEECDIPNKYFERLEGKLSPAGEYILGLINKYGKDIRVVTRKPERREASLLASQTICSNSERNPDIIAATPEEVAIVQNWAESNSVNVVGSNGEPVAQPDNLDEIVNGETEIEPREEEVPKGVLWFIKLFITGIFNIFNVEITPQLNNRIENIYVPLIEEILVLGIASFFSDFSLAYIAARAEFVALHLPQGLRAGYTPWKSVAIPLAISLVSFIPLSLGASSRLIILGTGALAHMLINALATLYNESYQKDDADMSQYSLSDSAESIKTSAGPGQIPNQEASPGIERIQPNDITAKETGRLLSRLFNYMTGSLRVEGVQSPKYFMHEVMQGFDNNKRVIIVTAEPSAYSDLNNKYGHTLVDETTDAFGSASAKFIQEAQEQSRLPDGLKYIGQCNQFGGRWFYAFELDRPAYDKKQFSTLLNEMLIDGLKNSAKAEGGIIPENLNYIIGVSNPVFRGDNFERNEIFLSISKDVILNILYNAQRYFEHEDIQVPQGIKDWIAKTEHSPPKTVYKNIPILQEYLQGLLGEYPEYSIPEALTGSGSRTWQAYDKYLLEKVIEESRDLISNAEERYFARHYPKWANRKVRLSRGIDALSKDTEDLVRQRERLKRVFFYTWNNRIPIAFSNYQYFGAEKYIPNFTRLRLRMDDLTSRLNDVEAGQTVPEGLRNESRALINEMINISMMTEGNIYQGPAVINTLSSILITRKHEVLRINGDYDLLSRAPTIEMGDKIKKVGMQIMKEEFGRIGIAIIRKGAGDEWVGIGIWDESMLGKVEDAFERINDRLKNEGNKYKTKENTEPGETWGLRWDNKPLTYDVELPNSETGVLETVSWSPSISGGVAVAQTESDLAIIDGKAEAGGEYSKTHGRKSVTNYEDIPQDQKSAYKIETAEPNLFIPDWLLPYTGLLTLAADIENKLEQAKTVFQGEENEVKGASEERIERGRKTGTMTEAEKAELAPILDDISDKMLIFLLAVYKRAQVESLVEEGYVTRVEALSDRLNELRRPINIVTAQNMRKDLIIILDNVHNLVRELPQSVLQASKNDEIIEALEATMSDLRFRLWRLKLYDAIADVPIVDMGRSSVPQKRVTGKRYTDIFIKMTHNPYLGIINDREFMLRLKTAMGVENVAFMGAVTISLEHNIPRIFEMLSRDTKDLLGKDKTDAERLAAFREMISEKEGIIIFDRDAIEERFPNAEARNKYVELIIFHENVHRIIALYDIGDDLRKLLSLDNDYAQEVEKMAEGISSSPSRLAEEFVANRLSFIYQLGEEFVSGEDFLLGAYEALLGDDAGLSYDIERLGQSQRPGAVLFWDFVYENDIFEEAKELTKNLLEEITSQAQPTLKLIERPATETLSEEVEVVLGPAFINSQDEMDNLLNTIERSCAGSMDAIGRCDVDRIFFVQIDEDQEAQYFKKLRVFQRMLNIEYGISNVRIHLVSNSAELLDAQEREKIVFEILDKEIYAVSFIQSPDMNESMRAFAEQYEDKDGKGVIYVNTVYPDSGQVHMTGLLTIGIRMLDYSFFNNTDENRQYLIELINSYTGKEAINTGNLELLLQGALPFYLPEIKPNAGIDLEDFHKRDLELAIRL